MAHLLKGFFLVMRGKSGSLAAFKEAFKLQPSIVATQGLVRANLELGNSRDAFYLAKNMASKMPRSSKVLTLVGMALSAQEETKGQAQGVFLAALKINPVCADTIAAYAQLLLSQSKFDDATKLLKDYLDNARAQQRDYAFALLGDVYSAAGNTAGALGAYNAALTLNPEQEAATRGLRKLQTKEEEEEEDEE